MKTRDVNQACIQMVDSHHHPSGLKDICPKGLLDMGKKQISMLCSNFLFVFFFPSNSRIRQELLKSQYFLLAAGKYLSNLSLGSVIFHMS